MARKLRGRPVHGWLALDKPSGMTSTQALSRVRRILDAGKAGHGGTLDPLATGVLPIAFGEATKTVSFAMDSSKSYRFAVAWGVSTDTHDRDGTVIAESAAHPSAAAIEGALKQFIGNIEQVPPQYSAIKVGGKRAYDLARSNQEFVLEPRVVRVERFEISREMGSDHTEFTVDCGKGTYVRALVRDLATALGTCGHIITLRRTRCGQFNEENSISLDKLEALGHKAARLDFLLPVATVLDDIPALALTGPQADRLTSGQVVRVLNVADGVYCAQSSERLVALAEAKDGEVRPLRVFHL